MKVNLPFCLKRRLNRPDELVQIALVKNTATEQSTAHDTSVILLDADPLFKAVLDDMQADAVRTIAAKVHNAMIAAMSRVLPGCECCIRHFNRRAAQAACS